MQTRFSLIPKVVLVVAAGACGGKTQVGEASQLKQPPTGTPSTATSGYSPSTSSSSSSSGAMGRGAAGGEATLDSSGGSSLWATGGAGDDVGGAAGEGTADDCSGLVLQRFESLETLAATIDSAGVELTRDLAEACFRISADLGQGPASLAMPPTIVDVRSACQSAVAAVEAAVAQLATGPTLDRQTCGCARDAEAYFECLEPCELLNEADAWCHDVCFCHTYCEALGMARPRCQSCDVTVEVDEAVLAATLEANLPVVYLTLDRADLVSLSANALVEAGTELGYQLDDACSAELTAPLDAALRSVENHAPELIELVGEARTIASAL